MSVRTEPRDLSQKLQQTLTIPAESMLAATGTAADAQTTEQHLAEANNFNTNSPDHPLNRTVCINIRASLSDLCLKASNSTWKPPSVEANRAIFQQKKFMDLGGSAENQGDLKSVVLHKMTLSAQKSSFPVALGVRITGVDDSCFSQTGESYSMITMPNADTHVARTLQEDNTELAYEFARKFPGYTAENLDTKGIHEVAARRFCLVAADHPLVSAISENAEKLQMGEISMMPEGLVKISSGLYETILPMVKAQVESQIKVRDLSHTAVNISPADFSSWHDVRTELMAEAKKGFKARVESEMAAAGGDSLSEMKAAFSQEERALEHAIDHTVHTFSASIDVAYNFLSQ